MPEDTVEKLVDRAVQPQPAPENLSDEKPLWEQVIKDIVFYATGPDVLKSGYSKQMMRLVPFCKGRDEFGLEKYGSRLTANNGRNPLVDAFQEILDSLVYMRQYIEECQSKSGKARMEKHYVTSMAQATGLAQMLIEEDAAANSANK